MAFLLSTLVLSPTPMVLADALYDAVLAFAPMPRVLAYPSCLPQKFFFLGPALSPLVLIFPSPVITHSPKFGLPASLLLTTDLQQTEYVNQRGRRL